jgi:hypothetical protein
MFKNSYFFSEAFLFIDFFLLVWFAPQCSVGSFTNVKKFWMPELQKQNPNVPVLLMGTKLDRVPEDLRPKVVARVRG